jgi:phage tail sheath gpL-like
MAVQIPFNYIPQDWLVPGFFFEVQPLDNTGLLPFQSLLIGQVLSTGSLGPTTVATSAASATGETLHFTSVPANVVPGMVVLNLTHGSTIASGTTVVSTTGTTVVLSAAVASGGPSEGDTIQFYPPSQPVYVSTATAALGLFGPGSMLANMVAEFRSINGTGTLYCLPLIDDPSSVAATGTITVAGTVTNVGVISLYVAGVSVPVVVTPSMSNASIAVAMVSAINSNSNLPVVASGSTFPITLTANNAGIEGNNIDVRINYYGQQNNEVLPAGLTFTFSGMSGGEVNPSLTVPLANCGSMPFDAIGAPYTDSTSLTSMQDFLNDSTGRWSFQNQLFGHYFAHSANSVGSLTTLAQDQNFQHFSITGLLGCPNPPYQIAAASCAQAAVSTAAQVGQPFNTLPLTNCLPPNTPSTVFTIEDRQTLLADGIATLRAAPGNQLVIDRMVTTYTENAYGQPDDSYQNAEKLFTVAYVVKYTASILSSLYSRVSLAADGTRVPVGAAIVTPSVVQGTMINIYTTLVSQAICQDLDNFIANVQVQINAVNRNRLDILMPITPINQLDTVAVAVQLVLG